MKYNKIETDDLYYIVELREEAEWELRGLTTIIPGFCGKLINNNNGNFYFELYSYPNSVVIIPHSWIKWMAPAKELNQFPELDRELAIAIDREFKRKYSTKWNRIR